MLRKMIVLTALLALSACGKEENTVETCGTPACLTLQPLVSMFANDATFHKVLIKLDGLSYAMPETASSVASCTGQPQGDVKLLTFSKQSWDQLDANTREAVVYHELGHCLLGRSHKNGFDFQNLRFYSVMNSEYIPGLEYWRNRTYYVKELFKPTGI